jgi:hypothetical protein
MMPDRCRRKALYSKGSQSGIVSAIWNGSKSTKGGNMIQIEVAQEILKQIESGECKKALLIEAKTIDLTFLGYPLVYDVTVTLE